MNARKFVASTPVEETEVDLDFFERLKAIKAGGAKLIRGPNGAEFVIMHRDDFEHVAGLAGIGLDDSGSSGQ